MIFDFFGGLLKVTTYQKPFPTQEQDHAKNSTYLKTRAY
jgi:hypothetical protein